MKYPYLIIAKPRSGYEIKAATVHAEDFAEAMELGAIAVRQMIEEARVAGAPFAVKLIEIMQKSGSMLAVKPPG